MNKRQKIFCVIFSIIILIASFCALGSESFLAGIIGLALSAGLIIYCFSGAQEKADKINLPINIFKKIKGLLKHKTTKRILIILLVLIVVLITKGIISSTKNAENEKKQQSEKWKRLSEDYSYLKNIEIISSKVVMEGDWIKTSYLFVAIKNKGDRFVSNLTIQLSYYDSENYLIKRGEVEIPKNEGIPEGKERKFKIQLYSNNYPSSQSDKIAKFTAELTSCRTWKNLFKDILEEK